MTTKEIIKILPFDMEFKTKLLAEYDTLDEYAKGDLVDVLWSGYCTYYQLKLNENIQKGLLISQDDQPEEALDGTFYQRMIVKTEKEIQDNLTKSGADVDLSATREELEKIIGKTN